MTKHAVSLTVENHEALKKKADKQKKPMSVLLNDILTNLGINEKDKESIVLQIPVELIKKNKEGLNHWLHARADMLVKHFYSK